MLRQHIDAILEAETEARRRLSDAERQAQALIAESTAARAPALEVAREEARRRGRASIERQRDETARERAQRIAETRARIEACAVAPASDAFIQNAVDAIAGLTP